MTITLWAPTFQQASVNNAVKSLKSGQRKKLLLAGVGCWEVIEQRLTFGTTIFFVSIAFVSVCRLRVVKMFITYAYFQARKSENTSLPQGIWNCQVRKPSFAL